MKEEINSLCNICILAASENRAISDDDPNDYLPRLIQSHNGDAEKIFASNLLPNPSNYDYASLPYAEFLNIRSQAIHKRMKHLCYGNNP
ncbi:MAG TPA: hypothetical protein VFB14_23515 [Bryobacteraceae bacterium]|nr:hypothetical protein [Bryobacteraceae bacterium]